MFKKIAKGIAFISFSTLSISITVGAFSIYNGNESLLGTTILASNYFLKRFTKIEELAFSSVEGGLKKGYLRFEDLVVSRKGHPLSDFSLQAKFLEANIGEKTPSIFELLKKIYQKEAIWLDSIQFDDGKMNVELKNSDEYSIVSGFNKLSIRNVIVDILDSRSKIQANSFIQKNYKKIQLPSIYLKNVETTAPVDMKTLVRDILLNSNVIGNIGNSGSFKVENFGNKSNSFLWNWKGNQIPIGEATTLYTVPPLAWIDSGNANFNIECFLETEDRLKVVIDLQLYDFHCREPLSEETEGMTFSGKATGIALISFLNRYPTLPLHVEVSLKPEEFQISELTKLIAAELIKKAFNENKEKVLFKQEIIQKKKVKEFVQNGVEKLKDFIR